MTFTWSTKGFDEAKELAGVYRKAALRALNRMADSAETQANRAIRERYNLTRAQVDPCMSVRAASISKLTAVIHVSGRRLPLMLFGARQTRAGASFAVVRGSRKTLRSGFIATMQSGHTGVFQRTGQFQLMSRGRYKGKRRETIAERRTISVAEMFNSLKIKGDLDKFVASKFPDLFKHELEYYTGTTAAPRPDKPA